MRWSGSSQTLLGCDVMPTLDDRRTQMAHVGVRHMLLGYQLLELPVVERAWGGCERPF
jgi:hypothetical protein